MPCNVVRGPNGRSRTRTSDPLIESQRAENPNHRETQALTDQADSHFATRLAILTQQAPLAYPIGHWPGLPRTVRDQIVSPRPR